jgi:vacuolar protein sorting-associated protein 11
MEQQNQQHQEPDEAVECPVCAPQNATIRQIRKAQIESAQMHELFLDALGRSKDRFGTVSEWFGRGVMTAGPQ